MVWMTATEALGLLNVRPQTLYANVSRGKIRAKADDADPRRSLYHRDDVLRMAKRSNGRRRIEVVSAQTMQYGDPVLSSSISTAADGRLLYRGQDAARLAETATLEDIAALLWECEAADVYAQLRHAPAGVPATPAVVTGTAGADNHRGSALAAGLLALARRSASDAPSINRAASALHAEAASILATLTDAMAGRAAHSHDIVDGACPGESSGNITISTRLASAWGRQDAGDMIRRALVLLADHELNASTFATRVAISTGAALAAGVLAGFATLSGPLHGGASAEFAQLITLAKQIGANDAIRQWLASDRPLPAFGHPLYSNGDPRAQALLKLLPELPPYQELAVAAEAQTGELPNIDYALSLLAAAYGLPSEAPFILFAVGRCVGWLAHAQEQVQANRLIRPRARYTGPT
jgi:citrate synthase